MIEIKHLTTGEIIRTVDADTLCGADLSGANLSQANLIGADLSGADLSGADLSWTNLSGAKISAHALGVCASALGVKVTFGLVSLLENNEGEQP